MITPSLITKHLKKYLPIITDLFTEKETVVGASSLGSVLSIEITDHGYSAGKKIVISAGDTRNEIVGATLNPDGTVRFETAFDHDLIQPSQTNDDQTLTMGGWGSVWDGVHDIDGIPNRRFFEVVLPDGETIAPTPDGNQYLVDNIGLGLQVVATVIDDDNFTVDISNLPNMPTGIVDGLEIISGFRIAAAADFKRAEAAYSKQNTDEPYLFVIMGDVDASKDRHTENDAIAGFTGQDNMLLRLLQNFSITVFIPTHDEISGADAQDLAYDTIYKSLLKAVYGYEFQDADNSISYVAITSGHGPGIYNSSYLTHVYDWQLPAAIDFSDGFTMQDDVAFRDIEDSFNLHDDDYATMTANINLDEEQ